MIVKDLMASQVETLGRNDTLSLAEDLMKMKRLRHLPVLEDDLVVGIVSQRDLFRAALSSAMGFGKKSPGRVFENRAHQGSDDR
jgi:acetoin utilization protein AcuB